MVTVSSAIIARIFFFYGLAFFCMGLAILLELSRISDTRLRNALRMLTFFGLVHGSHEWLEMFQGLEALPGQLAQPLVWQSGRIGILAISFLGLAGFGILLLMNERRYRKWRWTPVLLLALIWMAGLLVIRSRYLEFWAVADVWTRYALAVPAALLAAGALISLRSTFREAGMARFGRDSLFAALALAAYGIIGQTFTNPSALPPSTVINSDLFFELFGFPIQLFRAVMAILATVFVVRFLRAFEVERQQRIAKLQADRLTDAERREALRGELLNRVVQAQEFERQRIARELHDETGQALTAIGMGIRGVSGELPAGEATEHLNHLEDLTGHALNELQRLIAGLRPSHLDDLGLAAALRWYAGEVEDRAPLAVRVEIEGDEQPMPGLIKVGLFRVAQEALTNVVKHASADEAVVRVLYREDEVRLEIADDGIGFDVPGADRPSWGLIGMRERVALMGGEFGLSSQRGRGTRIAVTVPLEAHPLEEQEHAIATG
jgi:signal transduction histidine kinase